MNSNSAIECSNNQGRVFDETIELKDNAMLKIRPELFFEWDFEKNDEIGLDIYKVTKGTSKKAWWKCPKCSHIYFTRISLRVIGCGCSFCDNKRVLKGFNDMGTTNPKLASLLANPEDGYKYTQSSDKKVDWKCRECDGVKNKRIADVYKEGLRCLNCSDGFSIPEKIMYNLLKHLNCEFRHDTQFKWSTGKRYDFYIPSLKMIIETHGGQHSGNGFKSLGGRSLEAEIENDKYKYDLAKQNGVENYIDIDTRFSDFEYVKNNILQSDLPKFFNFDNIDWFDIVEKSQRSLSKESCDLWSSGIKDVKLISEMLLVHERTVIRYLTFWSSINKCDYTDYNNTKRNVVQLSINGEFIQIWSSIADAIKNNKVSLKSGNISKCCQGKRNIVGGFKWMYKEDYEKYLSTGIPPYLINKPHPNSKSVVKLNKDLDLLKVYETTQEAVKDNNIKNASSISQACTNVKKSAYGFKWMYKEDYEMMIKENGIAV